MKKMIAKAWSCFLVLVATTVYRASPGLGYLLFPRGPLVWGLPQEGSGYERITIVLPSREEMLERLRKVSTAPLAEQHFYPSLLACAGLEKSPLEFAAMLEQANRMFSLWASGREAGFDEYVDALVDDEQAAEAVKAIPHLTRLNLAGGGNLRYHFQP